VFSYRKDEIDRVINDSGLHIAMHAVENTLSVFRI